MSTLARRFDELRVVTSARWLADDLARQSLVPVVHDLGLWAPSDSSRTAWWMSGDFAARLDASGVRPDLRTPGPTALTRLGHEHLGRRVTATTLGDLGTGCDEWFIKPADMKVASLPAEVTSPADFTRRARAAGMPDELELLVSEPVNFTAEYRCFIYRGHVVAVSPYLIDGQTWDAWDAADLPGGADEAQRFATEVASALSAHVPSGWVLDVGLIDGGTWAVVETNPAWCSNPYWATEGEATGVVSAICASQGSIGGGELWMPPRRSLRPRPLPVRSPSRPAGREGENRGHGGPEAARVGRRPRPVAAAGQRAPHP